MQITRVLNTNAVLSADSDSNEIVLLGRGIGFKARPETTWMKLKLKNVLR